MPVHAAKAKAKAKAVVTKHLDSWLIRDWRVVLKRGWTIRVALIIAAVDGLYAAWPAFQDTFPLSTYAFGSIILNLIGVIGARLLPQAGISK